MASVTVKSTDATHPQNGMSFGDLGETDLMEIGAGQHGEGGGVRVPMMSSKGPRLLSLHGLPLTTEHTKDVPSGILPLPSATACYNHACCCSPCHHGAVLDVYKRQS